MKGLIRREFIQGIHYSHRGEFHSHTQGDREETVAWLGGEESGG